VTLHTLLKKNSLIPLLLLQNGYTQTCFSAALPIGEYAAVALLAFFGFKSIKDAWALPDNTNGNLEENSESGELAEAEELVKEKVVLSRYFDSVMLSCTKARCPLYNFGRCLSCGITLYKLSYCGILFHYKSDVHAQSTYFVIHCKPKLERFHFDYTFSNASPISKWM
jgi:hypothetical protein